MANNSDKSQSHILIDRDLLGTCNFIPAQMLHRITPFTFKEKQVEVVKFMM